VRFEPPRGGLVIRHHSWKVIAHASLLAQIGELSSDSLLVSNMFSA
jgi:hypothetical protein